MAETHINREDTMLTASSIDIGTRWEIRMHPWTSLTCWYNPWGLPYSPATSASAVAHSSGLRDMARPSCMKEVKLAMDPK